MATQLNGKIQGGAGGRITLYLTKPGERPSVLASTRSMDDGTFVLDAETEALNAALSAVRGSAGGAMLVIEASAPQAHQVLPVDGVARALRKRSSRIELGELNLAASMPAAAPAPNVTEAAALGLNVAGQRSALGERALEVGVPTEDLQQIIAQREGAILDLKTQVASLTTQRDDVVADRDRTKTLLDAATSNVSNLRDQVATASSQIATLSAQISARDQRIRDLEAAAAGPSVQAPVPLASVFQSLGEQVSASAQSLQKQGSFALSDVRFSLKMLLEDEGAHVRFPKAGETTGNEVSGLDFVLRPGKDTQPTVGTTSVPDVVGYTALVAERKLREAGLESVTSFQTVVEVAGQPRRAGRVVTQRPPAGTNVALSSRVELFIGRA